MKIIFIHGRAQGKKDPEQLKKIWIKTFEEGLDKNRIPYPSNLEVIFPYYGKILDSLVSEKGLPKTAKGIIARGNESDNVEFYNELISEIAKNADISDEQINAIYRGDLRERGPLNWEWIHAIIKAIDEHTPFGEHLLKQFTYDVFMYLTVPGIRTKINKIVNDSIGNDPCVVVGHSLGSVVGYNVLKENDTLKVKKYITVGSPLGLTSIRSQLATPIGMPKCIINGWYNAYDERDVVALNPLNKTYFDISPAIKNKNDVDNITRNRHGIEGYLNDINVAKTIYDSFK